MKKVLLSLMYAVLFSFSFANVELCKQLIIHFESNSFTLNQTEEISFLKDLSVYNSSNYYYVIEGHTDADGTLAFNQTLSSNRAQAVKNYLLKNNIAENQIFIKALAFLQPKSDNLTENGKQENRRVEIKIYKTNLKEQILPFTEKDEVKSLDPNKKQIIHFESGVTFSIPQNAFVDANGKPIKDSVTLIHKNYNNYKDFITSEIPMSFLNGTSDYFSSAGMFSLDAFVKDQHVYLQDGKEISVRMPATSNEIETELFAFSEADQKWDKVLSSQLKKVAPNAIFYDTVVEPVYNINKNCYGAGFDYYSYEDTILIQNLLAYFKNNKPSPEIVSFAKNSIAIDPLRYDVNFKEEKLTQFADCPSVKVVKNDNENVLMFSTEDPAAMQNHEVKLLRSIKIIGNESFANDYFQFNYYTNINVLGVTKKSIRLSVQWKGGNEACYELDAESRKSKKSLASELAKIDQFFSKTKQKRIENYNTSLEELEIAKKKLEVAQTALAEQIKIFEKDEYYQKVKEMCVIRTKYNFAQQSEAAYNKVDVFPLEAERYVLTLSLLFDNEYKRLLNVNDAIICNLKEQIGTINVPIKRISNLNETEAQALAYMFDINSLGVYNVDRLMKQDNLMAVVPKDYVDEQNNQLLISTLFLVGNDFNGVIKVNGYMGYTPYKFAVEDNKKYSIVAVDIFGNSYKMDASVFMKQIEQKEPVFSLKTVQAMDDLNDLASY